MDVVKKMRFLFNSNYILCPLKSQRIKNVIEGELPLLPLIFCKLDSLQNSIYYYFREGLQNLLFPEEVCFDKKTGDYRTMCVNLIAERIAVSSRTYGNGETKRDCDFTRQSRIVELPNQDSNPDRQNQNL